MCFFLSEKLEGFLYHDTHWLMVPEKSHEEFVENCIRGKTRLGKTSTKAGKRRNGNNPITPTQPTRTNLPVFYLSIFKPLRIVRKRFLFP